MNMNIKRAGIFCKDLDKDSAADKLNKMQAYARANNFVITQSFNSEMAVLDSRNELDIILVCNEQLLLPIAEIEIINVAVAY